jgi:L-aspartate oxidase
MGGIATDERGRTSVSGLWAVGEVASTGLHGANRLASNSLLEAAVFGARVAADIKAVLPRDRVGHFVEPRRISGSLPADPNLREAAIAQIRNIMTTYVGVVRNAKGLRTALAELDAIEADAKGDSVLANMALAARLIATAALMRKESRGGHYRSDFPATDKAQVHRTFMTLSDLGKNAQLRPSSASDALSTGCSS